jgi:sodium pump decarboxylase gamma subunit
MLDLLWQGVQISIMGISLTFAALGLIILTITLLERFSRSDTPSSLPDQAVLEEEAPEQTPAQSTADEEIAAAIAVALAYLRSQDVYQGDLGSTLATGPGAWWTMGRPQQPSIHLSRTTHWRN